MLKSISLSGNDVFHKAVSKKIVCTSELNSTFDTNAWAILKTLFDNLRSNSPLSRKTKLKLSENVISILVPFGKDRCLKYQAFQISLKKWSPNFRATKKSKISLLFRQFPTTIVQLDTRKKTIDLQGLVSLKTVSKAIRRQFAFAGDRNL